MPVNYTETPEGEVVVSVAGIVDDSYALAMFLQKLVPMVVEKYLRKRITQALANNSSGHSHWIEHVFLPRALYIFDRHIACGFRDDALFGRGMLKQLADRISGLPISGHTDVFVFGLIERSFCVRFLPDKVGIVLSFDEEGRELDDLLQKTLKEVLVENM